MDSIKIDCPHCGAAVERQKGEYFGKCPYCGAEVCFDDIKAESEVTGLRDKVNDLDWQITSEKQYKKQLAKWNKNRGREYIIPCIMSFLGVLSVSLSTDENDDSVMIGIMLIICALLLLFISSVLKCLNHPAFVPGNEEYAGGKPSMLRMMGELLGAGFLLLCGSAFLSVILCAIFDK